MIGRLSLRFHCIAIDTARSNAVPAPDSLQAWQGVPPSANIAPTWSLTWSRCLLHGQPARKLPVACRPATPAEPAESYPRPPGRAAQHPSSYVVPSLHKHLVRQTTMFTFSQRGPRLRSQSRARGYSGTQTTI